MRRTATSVPALRCWQVHMSRIWHATDLALAHGNRNIKQWWPASAEDKGQLLIAELFTIAEPRDIYSC
ncbi:hypothetical protein CMEL01_04126 [Colletotrichum melonis]|uniref:Uncharacterized protein n=1 Tax=Colletotrichum melonis TaxID=1209925 RepID=A0AAI9XMJ2_9PEZI|nr:hypothetical protein CMEL01_04126 [Colletotrichum melonis]